MDVLLDGESGIILEGVDDPAEDDGFPRSNGVAADDCHDYELFDAEWRFLVGGVAMWFDEFFDLCAKWEAVFDGVFQEFGFVLFIRLLLVLLVGFLLGLFIGFSLIALHAIETVLL